MSVSLFLAEFLSITFSNRVFLGIKSWHVSLQVFLNSTTMKTHIINETNQTFQLKEGNAGAFRLLRDLNAKGKDGYKFSIKVDPNATYREYMVATGKKGKSIIITSDDFSEYKVIKIVEEAPPPGAPPGTSVTYKSERSEPRNLPCSNAPVPSSAEGESQSHEGESKGEAESDPPGSSSAGVQSNPPAGSSSAGVQLIPAAGSSSAGVQSSPPAAGSSSVGVQSSPPAAGSSSAGGRSSQKEHVPWYKRYSNSPNELVCQTRIGDIFGEQ